MVTTSKQTVRKRRVFVSAPFGLAIDALIAELVGRGYTAVGADQLTQGGAPFHERLTAEIRRCDLVVAVLPSSDLNSNVIYEIGLAHALLKRVLIIASPKVPLPSDLQGALTVRASANDLVPIRFALDQIRAAPVSKRRSRGGRPGSSTKPIGKVAAQLRSQIYHVNEKGLEGIVRTALNVSGVQLIDAIQQQREHPDFAAWVDEVESHFGNPFIIEVKQRFSERADHDALRASISSFMAGSNAKWALVLYAEGSEAPTLTSDWSGRAILCQRMDQFLAGLEVSDFAGTVRAASIRAADSLAY